MIETGEGRWVTLGDRFRFAVGLAAWFLGPVCHLLAQTLAFPGAEGAGAFAVGGRGGDVYYVTTLADSGAGSLRTGISTAPTTGRTILFKVSGNIQLRSTLTVNRPRITIAGQTAPGGGICLQNYSFNLAANDLIIRHLRTRLGTNALQEADAMWINAGTNLIVDHLSASWSVDETLSVSRSVANAVRGGVVENIFVRNLKVGTVGDAAVQIDFLYEEGAKGEHEPVVRNLVIERMIVAKAKRVLDIRGFPGAEISGVRLHDSSFAGITKDDTVLGADVKLVDCTVTRER